MSLKVRKPEKVAHDAEDRDGSPSYRALADPSGKTDFHHPDSFVLALTDNGAQM